MVSAHIPRTEICFVGYFWTDSGILSKFGRLEASYLSESNLKHNSLAVPHEGCIRKSRQVEESNASKL